MQMLQRGQSQHPKTPSHHMLLGPNLRGLWEGAWTGGTATSGAAQASPGIVRWMRDAECAAYAETDSHCRAHFPNPPRLHSVDAKPHCDIKDTGHGSNGNGHGSNNGNGHGSNGNGSNGSSDNKNGGNGNSATKGDGNGNGSNGNGASTTLAVDRHYQVRAPSARRRGRPLTPFENLH